MTAPRRTLPWVAVAVVVAVVLTVTGAFSGSSRTTRRPAPALPRTVLTGPRVTLADLRGTPVIVNFWASWCGPCRHEARALEAFARTLHGRARLVGVDWNDGLRGARAFLRTYGWSFPTLRDADGSAGNAYGIVGLPTTFIVDRHGRIVRTLTGPQSVTSIQRALDAAL